MANILGKLEQIELNPNKTEVGYKVPKAFSDAYHFFQYGIWLINPSCEFLLWW